MRRNYENPYVEIVKIENEDVITTSGFWTSKGEDGKIESGAQDIFD